MSDNEHVKAIDELLGDLNGWVYGPDSNPFRDTEMLEGINDAREHLDALAAQLAEAEARADTAYQDALDAVRSEIRAEMELPGCIKITGLARALACIDRLDGGDLDEQEVQS